MNHDYIKGLSRELLDKEVQKVDEKLKSLSGNTDEIQSMLHSLHVYQAELELQNASLDETNAENQALREHYQSLFSHLPLPAVTVNKHFAILEANPAANRDIFNGQFDGNFVVNLAAFLGRASIYKLYVGINKPFAPGACHRVMLEVSRNDVITYFHVFISELNMENEQQYLLLFKDETQEETYRAQSSFFYNVLCSADDMLIALDLDGKLLLNSESLTSRKDLQDWSGFSNASVALDINTLPPQIAAELFDYIKSKVKRGEKQFKIIEVVEPNTPKKWYRLNMFPVTINSEVCGAGAIVSDHTEIINHEREMSLAIRVFNEGNQALMITDARQQIVQVNQSFETITGYSFDEVKGQTPKFLQSGRHDNEFYAELWAEIRKNGCWEGEIWNKRKNNEIYAQWLSISTYPKYARYPTNYIAVFRDITDKKQQESEIRNLAYYDSLTGCGNRRLLEQDIELLTKENSDNRFVLLFIDLDHFKLVNDVHGHDIGDTLIKAATKRFGNIIRQKDKIYRIGGDEFLILLHGVELQHAQVKADKLIRAASTPFYIKQHQLNISASIGIASFPENGSNFIELLKHADSALYHAKDEGRQRYVLFSPQIMSKVSRQADIEHALRAATINNEFSLQFMPQVCCDSGVIEQVEVLLRWNSELLGPIPPYEFIPVAEKIGLIHELTRFVLTTTIGSMRELADENAKPIPFSVNVSSADIRDDSFFDDLCELLHQHSDLAHRLTLELTESIFIDDYNDIKNKLNALKKIGIAISIDDFGTGFSSLAHLNNLPIDELKIDKSFVDDILQDKKSETLCRAIISMAKAMQYTCVAEGVESKQHFHWLKEAGCTLSQGYFHAKPMSFEQFSTLLLPSE